jgi:hypothetical protein
VVEFGLGLLCMMHVLRLGNNPNWIIAYTHIGPIHGIGVIAN